VSGERGFTLLELVLVVLIVGILSTIAVPIYNNLIAKARSVQAVSEINVLQKEIMMYTFGDSNQRLPATLAQLTGDATLDPWGRPYQYARAGTVSPRLDRFAVALNADYDLYSLGGDGESAVSLTETASRDDVVRADNGGYIGLASEY
jgi:general secretion pathway protein G